MQAPFKSMIKPDEVTIVAPGGEIRSRVKGYYGGKHFFFDDMTIDVRPGDEIRRSLPNGNEEAFHVDDPKYYDSDHFGKHYQVAISRPKIHSPGTGGNYTIHVSGENARVNVHSTDNSMNTVNHGSTFSEIREAIERGVADAIQKQALQKAVGALEKAPDKPSKLAAYQQLVSMAADHMTIIAPFLVPLGLIAAS